MLKYFSFFGCWCKCYFVFSFRFHLLIAGIYQKHSLFISFLFYFIGFIIFLISDSFLDMITTQANIIIYIQLPKTQNLSVNKVIYASWIIGRVLTSSVPSFSIHNWNPTGQCKVVAKIMDTGTIKPWFQSVFYCLLPVWPWTRHFSFLCPVSYFRVVVQIYSEAAWKSVWCGVGCQCLVAIIVILWAH